VNPGGLSTLTVLTLALLGAPATTVSSPDALFQQGLTACQSGQYTEAARAFRDSQAAQPASGTLLNLGLAEWRLGHAGEAVLSWEQALWIDPFNRDARDNLRFARRVGEIDPPDLAWYEVASTWLPAGAWAWLAAGSLWLAISMVLLPGVLRWRRAGWHQALAALGLGVFLLSIPSQIGVVTRARLGIVLERNVPLRLTPTRHAEQVATLTAGESARAVRVRGDYCFIRTLRGAGWVDRNQFGLVCPPPN
jgi:tetratricopeptide (TPR) repeat protein